MAFTGPVTQYIFLGEILRKSEECVSLQHVQHVLHLKALVWEIEITACDGRVRCGPLRYREKATNSRPRLSFLL